MDHTVTTASGVNMPQLIYGTAWKKERTTGLVKKAIKAGFRGIDTACQPKHYEESLVGEAIANVLAEGLSRSELFIQTKFTPLGGQDPHRIPYDKNAPLAEQVAQSFEVSKKNLQTDYVDSLVLHSPLFPFSHLHGVWKAMEAIVERGEARQIGISNCYDLDVLMKLYHEAKVKPAVLQNRFYRDTAYDYDLREWCDKYGIIYQSFWSLTANPHILAHKTIIEISRMYEKTEPQIFFAFLRHIGIVALSGTTSSTHMQEDLQSLEITLSKDDVHRIGQLLIP